MAARRVLLQKSISAGRKKVQEWFGFVGAGNYTIYGASTVIQFNPSGLRCPHDGDIIKFKTNFGTLSGGNGLRLKIWRQTDGDTYMLVGQDSMKIIETGEHEYAVDSPIAVQTGDIIGIYQAGNSQIGKYAAGHDGSKSKFGDLTGTQSGWTTSDEIPLCVQCLLEY